jgi:hypothetical protein
MKCSLGEVHCSTLAIIKIHEKRDIPNSLSSTPDFQIADISHLLVVSLAIVRSRIIVQASLSFLAISYTVVELIEHRLEGILELGRPIDCTTSGSGRASSIHVIHTISPNERVERLRSLLNSLIESFGRRMTTFAEDFVLREEHAVDTTHQAAALTVEIGEDFFFESGLVEVATADGDTESNGFLFGFACYVLVDGDGGVDAAALTEEGADSAA